jgi:hypothetical protein
MVAFSFLGGAEVTRSTITVLRSAGIRTLEEARQKELVMAAGGRASGGRGDAVMAVDDVERVELGDVLGKEPEQAQALLRG